MRLLAWFVLGWLLAWGEALGRQTLPGSPDPRLIVLVLVLVRTARTALPSRVIGLSLGAPAFGAGEPGPWLIATAVCALLLFPVRRNLRVDHPLTVAAATVLLLGSLLLAHRLGVELGRSLGWPPGSASWWSAASTILAAPLLCELGARLSHWLPFLPRLAPDPADAGALRAALPRPPLTRPGLGRPGV